MSDKQLSLHHLVSIPSSEDREPDALYPTILALHGRGSHEGDLIELAPHLPPGLLWVSPRAPLGLGPDSYEWYRVRVVGKPDPDQVMAAIDTLNRFIDEMLSAYPVDPGKLYLLGFSQGSMLSLCYALTHPRRIAGVIAQSGYLPSMDLEISQTDLVGKPFLLIHGVQDTMIPIEWDRRSRDRLQELGVDLTYREFQMGHTVSMESLEVISGWLKERLGRTRLDS
jgi:phospholipase/carboxylesterase